MAWAFLGPSNSLHSRTCPTLSGAGVDRKTAVQGWKHCTHEKYEVLGVGGWVGRRGTVDVKQEAGPSIGVRREGLAFEIVINKNIVTVQAIQDITRQSFPRPRIFRQNYNTVSCEPSGVSSGRSPVTAWPLGNHMGCEASQK